MKTNQNEQSQKLQTKTLKTKQKQIIDLLLRFRHLQQPQIQQFLNHKHKERIRTWLNDLTDRQYVFRIYEKEVEGKPSEYCLDKGSISYLKEKGRTQRLIKRIYKEKTNSQTFRIHSQFLATVYLSLLELTANTKARLNFYTKDDLRNIKYLILPHPDCYFAITERTGMIQRYFLDIFDNEKFMYKRVYQYLNYFNKQYWQKHSSKPFPKIIFVCPNVKAKLSLHKFIQKKINAVPIFYLAINDDVKTHGFNKNILTEVE